MATGGNLKKRIARFVRRSREAFAATRKTPAWASRISPPGVPEHIGESIEGARVLALEAQVRDLRSGWDALIPEILDTVSATHRHSLGATSLQGRLDVLREDVDILTRRVDLELETLTQRIAALEGRSPSSAPGQRPRRTVQTAK